jgi:hypothetical protein
MRPKSPLTVAVPLLILSGAAAAAPVSATFSGVMADNAVDFLGAFGPADANLAGAAIRTTISFDNTLAYTATGTADHYTDAAPGSGAITIAITIGGVTLTNISTYSGFLQAITIGADTEAVGYAADAPGDVLGYGIASLVPWTAGTMDTSASFETLLTLMDPDQLQYIQVGTAPGQYEYLAFTPGSATTDQAVIDEPRGLGLLAVSLLGLGIARRRGRWSMPVA